MCAYVCACIEYLCMYIICVYMCVYVYNVFVHDMFEYVCARELVMKGGWACFGVALD